MSLEIDRVRGARQIADLGSGAGFPGLPWPLPRPAARVHLVEANARKCEFLRAAVAAARADNVEVIEARAELWPGVEGGLDLVTARALAPLPVVAEYAAPLLRLGGVLVAWRGGATKTPKRGPPPRRPSSASRPPLRCGWSRTAGLSTAIYTCMSKVRPHPPGFPRRPGMAVKRPLGGRRDTSPRV